jgi:hypothetical protein
VKDAELNHAAESRYESANIDARLAARVAELERALAITKEEQSAMREELEKARSHRDQDIDKAWRQPCTSSGAEEHSRDKSTEHHRILNHQIAHPTRSSAKTTIYAPNSLASKSN